MNALIKESSPYLLQHAHNPVNWYPWGEEALRKARTENKPILVSIGYSACHWCHVMERESFESKDIAEVMNTNFICIKIDREERPDLDNIYIDAVQAMGLRAGWPLNVFLMPNQKPFYGGTYFPPTQWQNLLGSIADAFKNNRNELEKSADGFTKYIAASEIEKYGLEASESIFTLAEATQMYQQLSAKLDLMHGGINKAPKFPMPSIWRFLLHYAYASRNEEALQQLNFTLQKMAFGGIYDQIGGGFARYSVDSEWFCPHFEKMLYDNAQLISLYAEAYNYTKNPLFKHIAQESIAFVVRELRNEDGGFFSALDADSEGQEGKFYIWKKRHLIDYLQEDTELFCSYYNVLQQGNWEYGNNILFRTLTDEEFAEKHQIPLDDLQKKITLWKNILLEQRAKKVKPGMDDKILTAWNGLMLKGLVDAYKIFAEETYLLYARQNADFLMQKVSSSEGFLWRSYKNGEAKIKAYLEDYASVIEAMIALYQVTFETEYLTYAEKLTEYTLSYFYDEKEEMFFYTDSSSEELIARKKEIFDNVIPASNSIMAHNLHFLGVLLENEKYQAISQKMLARMKRILLTDIEYAANWGVLFILNTLETAEVAVIGEKYKEIRKELEHFFYPNKVIVGSKETSEVLPLLKNRTALNDKTTIYVCFGKACQLPVFTVEEALNQMK